MTECQDIVKSILKKETFDENENGGALFNN